MIRRWLVMFSGFMQRAGQVNGTVRIWRELCERHSGPDCQVIRLPWDADAADLAELISRLGDGHDDPPQIVLMGYSWGGMTACNMARELKRRGLNVERLILCDAVYRHHYSLGWWRAFAPWRSLRVPDNVLHVTHARQQNSLPQGHPVIADDPARTTVDPVQWLATDHCWADDSPWFLRTCLEGCAI